MIYLINLNQTTQEDSQINTHTTDNLPIPEEAVWVQEYEEPTLVSI